MRAIALREYGVLETLRLEQVGTPHPGVGETLVRVRATAVNRLDIWVHQNVGHVYGSTLPLIPGYDVAGEVADLGPSRRKLGITYAALISCHTLS